MSEHEDIAIEIADPQWWYYAAFLQDVIRRAGIQITAALTTAQPTKQTHIATMRGIVIVAAAENATQITIQPFGDTRPEWEEISRSTRRFFETAQSIRRSVEPTADELIERYYRSRAAGGKVTLKQLAGQHGFNYKYLSSVKSAYDERGGWGSKIQVDQD